ncbi:uncharacterized protein N7506_003001 [Penicillium brevicompactum]|uniref:uncharacterized protein n=1 Tax=Penicillium brevicompactum TaxID=5074 RepID=UPI0025425D97|nr:uncharacterized protein N7506_003001 [Penicillium brevicompactum]KAJ5343177.1 hypothetical protein N7506_003001 [Penicillium brevicompactum]
MKASVAVSVFALLAQPFASAASTLAYCASVNTGSSFSAVTDTFQSNGACQTTCKNYALGVLQGKRCWCTNVAPAKSSLADDTSDCDTGCPGYPSDSCGSASKAVYAYVAVSGNDVTSTAGGSTSSSTTSSTSSSETTSAEPETVTVTASDFATSASKTTSTPSKSETSDTSASVAVETNSGGEVKTITVAGSSATAGADNASANTSEADSSKLSGGSIAGIVIGVLGGLALVGALVFLIFFYRKRARSVSPIPSQDMTDNRTSRGSSFMRGFFPQGEGGPVPTRSGTTFTDNRMKTNTVLYPNGPRDSSVSLQDNEDYSRPVLRLTNPD